MLTITFTLFSLIPFYLLGAFPTGQILAWQQKVDLSKEGSGNVGATNALRVLGKKAGALTLGGDISKGLLAVVLGSFISNDPVYISTCALAVVLGHCFSIPPYLKGGKGVATALGAFIYLIPSATLFGIAVFVTVFGFMRVVSVSSVSAIILIPLFLIIREPASEIIYAVSIIAVVVAYKHLPNLKRFIEGKESRM